MATEEEGREVVIESYKGFDLNFQCRGFQFEVGKTYEVSGKIQACENGFHACEHPLNVLRYYGPAKSRYAVVKQSGEISRHGEDTKIASAKITVEAEIKLPELIARAVKYVFDRAKPEGDESFAKGANGLARASGNYDAATASGNSGAATASGYYGAATASGYYGAATASGYSGAATASGNSGAATASGYYGAATASGRNGRAKGADGCALFLVYRDHDWKITHAWAGIVGQDGIKPDVFYSLDESGKPVEA